MIRVLFAVLLSSAYALPAVATPTTDFMQAYPLQNSLQRAGQAYEICDQLLRSDAQTYAADLRQLGEIWRQQPEPTYYVLSTCQAMWTSRYLDPIKASQIKRNIFSNEAAYKLAQLDILGSAEALRAQIRLYNQVSPGSQTGAPPAPYEILSGMASTERELAESLSMQTKLAVTAVIGAGGLALQLILQGRTVAAFVSGASGTASASGAVPAVAIFVLSYAAVEATDYGVWLYREHDLWSQLKGVKRALAAQAKGNTSKDIPLPVLFDEFYRATERLGYFYSYDLYLSESGQPGGAQANSVCLPELREHFAGSPLNSLAQQFDRGTFCHDAATVWTGASLWLTARFPHDANARYVAERLMARAKRTVWAYLETEKYKEQNPDCGFIWNFLGCAH